MIYLLYLYLLGCLVSAFDIANEVSHKSGVEFFVSLCYVLTRKDCYPYIMRSWLNICT